jgi:hypothetical protein
MKNLLSITALMFYVCITSCTSSPEENAKYSIKSFMKVNLKIQNNYEPISFSAIETLAIPDTMTNNRISYFKIKHNYSVMNDLKEKVNMNVEFYLDKDYRVNGANVDDLTRNE